MILINYLPPANWYNFCNVATFCNEATYMLDLFAMLALRHQYALLNPTPLSIYYVIIANQWSVCPRNSNQV